MKPYKTPGVYVEEISTLPPSVAEVSTAIPAFIGYTEKGLKNRPTRISSMVEYKDLFGGPNPAAFEVDVAGDGGLTITRKVAPAAPAQASHQVPRNDYLMYYCLKMFFDNGGGPCYIVSVGLYQTPPAWDKAKFDVGIELLKKEDEPTLIVLTDAVSLGLTDYLGLCQKALDQCGLLQDRFTIIDVPQGSGALTAGAQVMKDSSEFRDIDLGTQIKYGASYYPYLQTTLNVAYKESDVTVNWPPAVERSGVKVTYIGGKEKAKLSITENACPVKEFEVKNENEQVAELVITMNSSAKTRNDLITAWQEWEKSNDTKGFKLEKSGDASGNVAVADADLGAPSTPNHLEDIKKTSTQMYSQIKAALDKERVVMPPSAAMAGIYAKVDRDRGVWKAPANVSVASVIGPTVKITGAQQENLNVDATAGKSINAIRSFTGKGTLVWGGRTLAGNDNEWRYINVRRLFIMIEESTQKATSFAVFEANDATTWLKVKGMIESFLYGLWEQGALAGPKPESAYYVNVGLGKTMTTQDVLEGRMIVEIGVAAVRPAEFIILKFSHKLQQP